ncbi:hypothetical protein MAR_021400, partial [Mya arenaria]
MKKHRDFNATESGLTVSLKHPYLAASPDLIVQCDCCGKGLCEVKCPETVKDQIPTVDNIKYLLEENDKIVLDSKHPYYFQGTNGHSWPKLLLTVRVCFDMQFWSSLEKSLSSFWTKHMFQAICENQTPLLKTTGSYPNNNAIPVAAEQNVERPAISARRALIPISTQPLKRKKKTRKAESKTLVFLCGICGLDCLDEPQ